LLYCQDDQLEYYDKKCIDLYDSLAPNGMNCTSGGETNKQLSNNTKTNILAMELNNSFEKMTIEGNSSI
jgi:hypothetical protein